MRIFKPILAGQPQVIEAVQHIMIWLQVIPS